MKANLLTLSHELEGWSVTSFCLLTSEACGNDGRDNQVTYVGANQVIEGGNVETGKLTIATGSVSHRA